MTTPQDLVGKIYVVTGANSGIGYEAALDFASRGASLALVCRSEQRGRKACDAIIEITDNTKVKLYLADFCLLASVASLATELLRDYPHIDVLCNNAGSVNAGREITNEGFETTFVANHLAGFLLTQLLLPLLETAGAKGESRVVFTSSFGHKNSPLNFDDLNLEQGYSGLKAYGRSKLMNLLTAREFHRRYKNKKLIASSFHPGAVRTFIWGKGGFLGRLLGLLMYPFMVNIKEGTDTFIWLASSNDQGSVQAEGNYFYKRRQPSIAAFATDEAAEKLWQASMGLIEPYLTAVD
jgi:retinol dehydrogenase-12